MSTKKNKKKATKKKKPLTPQEKFKIEVAKELGLYSKVKELGWAGLTAAESGKIGGYMTKLSAAKKKKGN